MERKDGKALAKRATPDRADKLIAAAGIPQSPGRNEAAVLGASGNNVGDATVALLLTDMFPDLNT